MTLRRTPRSSSAELNTADVRYGYDNTPAGPEAVTTISRFDDDLGVRNVLTSVVLYDDLRRPVQSQSPGREEDGALRDGRVVTSTGYDTRGLPIIATSPAFTAGVPAGGSYWSGAEPPAITTTVYDGAGRPTQETFAAANSGPTWTTTTSYGGDRVTVTPPTGATKTTTVTDARGRMTALLQYATPADTTPRQTAYTWTPAGQMASMTDPGGNIWTWTYDLLGRPITADDPDAGQTTSTYTRTGQLETVTDARGQVLTYTYDDLDRQRVRYDGAEDPVNKLAEWTYDPLIGGTRRPGLPDAAIRYLGDGPAKQEITQQVTGYDALGRPTEVTATIPAITGLIPAGLAGSYATETAYNGDGSVKSQELGSFGPAFGRVEAESLRYFNDEFGRPQALAGAGAYVADTVRNAFGEVLRYSYGNTFRREAWQRFSYQAGTRRLTQTRIDREIDTTAFEVLNYEYDLAGNPTKVATSGQVGSETRCYTYDGFRQLTAAWTPADANCAAAPSPTATPPAPTLGGIAPYANTWTFDTIGNRTSETTYRNNAAPTTTEYTYAGQTADPKHDPHQLTGLTGGAAFVYDDAGNTTQRTLDGVTQTLDWDAEGRLEKVSDSTGGSPGTELARHIYGADGERLLKRDPTGTTLYLGDTEITLNTAGTATSWQRHYTFDGQTVAVRYGNKMTDTDILIADPQNTAQHAIKTNDSQVTSRRTLPFGAVRKTDGTIGTDPAGWRSHRGFVGSTSDTATGLLRVGARDYDPLLGRFITVDPILDPADPQQVNPYGYANNNPISFADPTGLKLCGNDSCSIFVNPTTGKVQGPGYQDGKYVGGQAAPTQTAPVTTAREGYIEQRAAQLVERSGQPGVSDAQILQFARAQAEWQWDAAATNTTATLIGIVKGAIFDPGQCSGEVAPCLAEAAMLFPVMRGFKAGKIVNALEETGDAAKTVRYGPMNPGPLDDAIANTFRSGSYTAVTSSKPTSLYRVYSGNKELGSYWTRTKPSGPVQSIIDSALDPAWGNQATNWVKVRVPAGTTFYEGAAASQGGLVGGGNQVFISRVDPSWVVGRGGF